MDESAFDSESDFPPDTPLPRSAGFRLARHTSPSAILPLSNVAGSPMQSEVQLNHQSFTPPHRRRRLFYPGNAAAKSVLTQKVHIRPDASRDPVAQLWICTASAGDTHFLVCMIRPLQLFQSLVTEWGYRKNDEHLRQSVTWPCILYSKSRCS